MAKIAIIYLSGYGHTSKAGRSGATEQTLAGRLTVHPPAGERENALSLIWFEALATLRS